MWEPLSWSPGGGRSGVAEAAAAAAAAAAARTSAAARPPAAGKKSPRPLQAVLNMVCARGGVTFYDGVSFII